MKAIITGCILLAVTACSHTNRTPPQPIDDNAIESGTYRLQNTTTFSLDSKETGSTYNIAISFPSSYSSAQNTTTYPVIYVLDGQWQFPLVNTISGAVNYDGDMPEALVVGISWKETDGNLMALRERDLIHSASECATGSCNAIKFQNFLRNELFPHIETHYKGGAHRTVTGGSSSALFAIYTLLSQPTLFNGYIASSPSLWRENESINTIMENFPINPIANKTRLYISWGELESSENIPRFAETLKRKKIPNLEVISAPVLNSGHAGVNAEGYTKGLQFVFQKPDLLLTQTRLNTLTGRYKSKDDLDDIQFIVKDKKLHAMFSDGQSFPLNASNESEFYIQGNAMTFTFNSQSNELRLNSRGTLFEFIRR